MLVGDKFMPEMHLRQLQFTYSACGPFTNNKERIQKFKELEIKKYIYRNELDKACCQHNMAYGDFKDFARRTAVDNILKDKAFNIVKDSKYDGYLRGLASMVYKFFDNKSASLIDKSAVGSGIKSMSQNEQLSEELHKPIIRNF